MTLPTPPARRKPKTAKVPIQAVAAAAVQRSMAIVGIGASAGGLEAMEQFLKGVPLNSGLAFVIVQHMDPTRKGMLVELLQRATAMPVLQVSERAQVQPDQVYVIPPNKDLSILNGVLHLLKPIAPRGLRLPIDFFLRSLAADQHQRAIGVILSGMGEDGTLGLRAIKEHGGGAFAQDPVSARFDSMPRSAISTTLTDGVAPAEKLAGKIITWLRLAPGLTAPSGQGLADPDQSSLEQIVAALRMHTGHDFSLYKNSTLYRRIERRMGLHQLPKIADYARYVSENPDEADLLFNESLIGVTRFFRDTAVWQQLKTGIIPALLANQPAGTPLRAWCAGCSTGEEAYSLAIIFQEALEQIKPARRQALQIFATDLSRDAIDRARAGCYPASIAADVSAARLSRFFAPEASGYRVAQQIREMVIFAPHSLSMDPPFTRLDLLVCRNLLIYLKAALQKKLLPLFHYSLKPGGILLLGNSESIGQGTDLFAALPGKAKFYQRKDCVTQFEEGKFFLGFAGARAAPVASDTVALPNAKGLKALAQALLLRDAPAAVLTSSQGDVVCRSGKTGKYLNLAAGKTNLNLFTMAREGLGSVLTEAFNKALRQRASVSLQAVALQANGSAQRVQITVEPLREPTALRGMLLVTFADVAIPAPKPPGKGAPRTARAARLAELDQALEQCRAELQSSREEMQTSQEELQSTNEELQSTNEELTTSREEMQSMNEELRSVNSELLARMEQASRDGDDLKNLLSSTGVATLFLDRALNVRSFTPQTSALIKLIPGDVGRPITDLASVLDYPALADDARQVLRTLASCEQRVRDRDGHWFRVRIMPYLTQDKQVDGVVVTFIDVSVSQALEAALRESLALLQTRYVAQTNQLDAATLLQGVMHKAQALLEQRLTMLEAEIGPDRTELKTRKGEDS